MSEPRAFAPERWILPAQIDGLGLVPADVCVALDTTLAPILARLRAGGRGTSRIAEVLMGLHLLALHHEAEQRPITSGPDLPTSDIAARWIYTADVAELLDCGTRNVVRLAKDGTLPGEQQRDARWRFRADDIRRFQEDRSNGSR